MSGAQKMQGKAVSSSNISLTLFIPPLTLTLTDTRRVSGLLLALRWGLEACYLDNERLCAFSKLESAGDIWFTEPSQ